jgi:hypothetical protein
VLLALALLQAVYLRRFLADDSYFYLVTARNIALKGQQTFSGVVATNGLHPLWLYLLSGWYGLIASFHPAALENLLSVLPLSFTVLAAGTAAAWQSARSLQINPPVFALLPAGFLLAFNLVGSEAYLLFASLAILCWLAITRLDAPTAPLELGLAAGAVVLSRLDTIFFALLFLVWLQRARGLHFALQAAAVFSIPLLLYGGSNLYFFGGLLPISGWLKSSFPMFHLSGLQWGRLGTNISGYNLLFGVAPVVYALLVLLRLRTTVTGPASLVWVFFGGTALHFLYTAAFTWNGTGWLWYYILPICLGVFSHSLALRHLVRRDWRPAAAAATMVVLLGACLAYGLRTAWRDLPQPNQAEAVLAILAEQQIENAAILVGDSAGETAFFTQNRVVSLDMLTANRRFVDAMLAAPNGFQFVLDCAVGDVQPVFLIWTTGTWLGTVTSNPDGTELVYWFKPAGSPDYHRLGALQTGPPAITRPGLVGWEIPGHLIQDCAWTAGR